MVALLDKVWKVVYSAGKAVFLQQAQAVTGAGRGRGGGGGETDQPLYFSGALEARRGKLGLEQAGGERRRGVAVRKLQLQKPGFVSS